MTTTLAILALLLSPPPEETVKVFILAGQSNMQGQAKLTLLEHQIKAPGTADFFKHLHRDGAWIERDDVWINFLDRKGKLTVGYGAPGKIGPELQFGHTLGDHYDAPVLIVKAAFGGRSLYRDFRPPSSGLPSEEVLAAMLERAKKKKPETTMDDVKGLFGFAYRDVLNEVKGALSEMGTRFPALAGRKPELAGFVYFQGWNDMINADYTAEYAKNLANFIRDMRKDLGAPKLPFVIGQMGVGGMQDVNPKQQAFRDAQAEGAGLPEFEGNVALVATGPLWDMEADAVFKKGWKKHLEEWNTVGSDRPYHYLGSAKFHVRAGRAFAEALLRLRGELK